MISVSPADESKSHLARYEQILKYLDNLKNSEWTPLPKYEITSESR